MQGRCAIGAVLEVWRRHSCQLLSELTTAQVSQDDVSQSPPKHRRQPPRMRGWYLHQPFEGRQQFLQEVDVHVWIVVRHRASPGRTCPIKQRGTGASLHRPGSHRAPASLMCMATFRAKRSRFGLPNLG